MRKIGFDPGLIRPHFFHLCTPEDINLGNCFNWAYIAYRLFTNVELWSTMQPGVHAFIRRAGRFYDSEALAGVEDYQDLPCLSELCELPRQATSTFEIYSVAMPLKEFYESWLECAFNPRALDAEMASFLRKRRRLSWENQSSSIETSFRNRGPATKSACG